MTAKNKKTELTYPFWLESWWIDRASEILGRELSPESRELDYFSRGVSDLSRSFIDRRKTPPLTPELLVSYGLFYFPQMFVRIQQIFSELSEYWDWTPRRELRILDLGGGQGAASLGAVAFLGERFDSKFSVEIVDSSREMLESSLRLFRECRSYLPDVEWNIKRGSFKDLSLFSGQYDIVLASFSISEAFSRSGREELERWAAGILERLDDNGLFVMVEPADEESAQRLQKLRDDLLKRGSAQVAVPCLHSQRCPLLKLDKYFCHQVRHWTPPLSLSTINRRLQFYISYLKYSLLVVQPVGGKIRETILQKTRSFSDSQEEKAEYINLRLLSSPDKSRGAIRLIGCSDGGEFVGIEILNRHLDKDLKREILKLEKGDVIGLRGELKDLHSPYQKRLLPPFSVVKNY